MAACIEDFFATAEGPASVGGEAVRHVLADGIVPATPPCSGREPPVEENGPEDALRAAKERNDALAGKPQRDQMQVHGEGSGGQQPAGEDPTAPPEATDSAKSPEPGRQARGRRRYK